MLEVVDEMVFRRFAGSREFRPKGLVFEDTVEECSRRIHPGSSGGENTLGKQAQCLGVPFESAVVTGEMVEGAFAGVTEGRVAEIVGEANGLNEVGIDAKGVGEQGIGLAE